MSEVPAVERRFAPPVMTHGLNPVLRRLLQSRIRTRLDRGLMVLHVTGRRTGRVYDVVVGRHVVDGELLAHANGGWRVNLRGGADLEVTLDGRRRPAYAVLVEDPDRVTDIVGTLLRRFGHEHAVRIGLRVNLDRMPTRAEIRDGTRGDAYAVLTLAD